MHKFRVLSKNLDAFTLDTMNFFQSLKKNTPFSLSQFPKSTEQNSRSPKTMTLYSENNGKTCCKLVGE
jgi:hypothetical protein